MSKIRGKTDWPLLRRVAEISPKEYATQIKRRNVVLLEALNTWEPGEVVVEYGSIGCPHCEGDCAGCLWNVADETSWNSKCICVRFGGVHLARVNKPGRGARIYYHEDREGLYIAADAGPAQVDECRRFLERHIEWAEKPWWGAKLGKGAKRTANKQEL